MTSWGPTTTAPRAHETADLIENFGQSQLATEEFWLRYDQSRETTLTELESRRDEQALDQEQLVFERRMEQDARLFPITLAMAWVAFAVLLLVTVCVAAGGTNLGSPFPEISMALVWGQLIGVSVRLWMLHGKRGTGELEPTTRPVGARDEA